MSSWRMSQRTAPLTQHHRGEVRSDTPADATYTHVSLIRMHRDRRMYEWENPRTVPSAEKRCRIDLIEIKGALRAPGSPAHCLSQA